MQKRWMYRGWFYIIYLFLLILSPDFGFSANNYFAFIKTNYVIPYWCHIFAGLINKTTQ